MRFLALIDFSISSTSKKGLIVLEGRNLIKNGTFSSGDEWTFSPRSTLYPGEYLLFRNDSTGDMRWVSQRISIFPATRYMLSYYAKRQGRYDTWAGFHYVDNTGEARYIHFPSSEYRLQDDLFVKVEYTFTTPFLLDSEITLSVMGGADRWDGETFLMIKDVTLYEYDNFAPAIAE